MKRIKVLLDFIKLAVAEKIVFYRNAVAKLTNNVTFPDPDISLEEAGKAVDAMETSYIASRDGSHTATAQLRANEAAADEIFRVLAAYIDRVSVGDETKILSAGFHATKQPLPIQKATLTVLDGAN